MNYYVNVSYWIQDELIDRGFATSQIDLVRQEFERYLSDITQYEGNTFRVEAVPNED